MSQNYVLPDEPDVPASEQLEIGRLADLVGQELGPGFKVVWVSVVRPEYAGGCKKVYLLDRELALEYKYAMGDSFYHESFPALTDGRKAFPVIDEPVDLTPIAEVEEVIRKAALEKLSSTERRLLGFKNE